ncbi:SirB1 family protein [Kiloniella antarctica]|uniref:SirB1 family protein n=1 Tax=Kiloniella antarctica TaxID=1550907 RepID=A0ABW5BH15_9PROT
MLDRKSLDQAEIGTFLQAIGQAEDDSIDVAECALLLAASEQNTASLDRYRDHLKCLVKDAQSLKSQIQAQYNQTQYNQTQNKTSNQAENNNPTINDCLGIIETVLYDLHGYKGDKDNYNDLKNANIISVIDQRKGLPIVLGILYMHIARSLGWNVDGLNFPGHFLLRFVMGKDRQIIDPFERGAVRNTPWLRSTLKSYLGKSAELTSDYSRSVTNRGILLRLQNNVKIRLIEAQEPEKALLILQQMLLIAPREPSIWREAGMLQAFLNNILAAIDTLEHYLMIEEDPRGHPEAANLLRQLKAQLN